MALPSSVKDRERQSYIEDDAGSPALRIVAVAGTPVAGTLGSSLSTREYQTYIASTAGDTSLQLTLA